MLTDKQELIQLGRKLATSVTKDYNGRWCFFAGFAFVLNGVEKNTHDIDVLTKDKVTYQYMVNLLQQLGLQLVTATNDFSSFKIRTSGQNAAKDLTLDLLCITSQWLKPLEGMWTKLESKKVEDIPFPVLRPIYLILLKILVNSHRQLGDRKKEQDFRDIQQLMAKRRITDTQVIKEGANQGLEDITREFLDKLKSMKIQ